MLGIFISLVLLLNSIEPSLPNHNIAYNIPDPGGRKEKNSGPLLIDDWFMPLECTGTFHLCTDLDKERLGRLAIRAIHEQMDDDKDGMIEASETSDVSRENIPMVERTACF